MAAGCRVNAAAIFSLVTSPGELTAVVFFYGLVINCFVFPKLGQGFYFEIGTPSYNLESLANLDAWLKSLWSCAHALESTLGKDVEYCSAVMVMFHTSR